MAKITLSPKIGLEFHFSISESEARALDGLAGYGDDAFIVAFKEKLGAHYIRDHEEGLREFLTTIRKIIPPALAKLDETRRKFNE